MDSKHSSSGSPRAPFMERMMQSLGAGSSGGGNGGGGGGPSSPGSGSPSNKSGSQMNRNASAAVLRRRDRDARNALSFAARALTDVVDTVEQAAKKVSFGSIATAVANIAREKKKEAQSIQQPAPLGVTHAFSVVFTHVLSPLWSVDRKPMPVPVTHVSVNTAESVRLMREMEALQSSSTFLEQLLPTLQSNVDLSTLFIILLSAKIHFVESQEALVVHDVFNSNNNNAGAMNNERGAGTSLQNPTFEQLCLALKESFLRSDDLEMKYEDRPNDEIQVADHAKRRLEEVGGRQWKPKGATLLLSSAHELRQSLLVTLMHASVVLTYNYYDPLLQFIVDEICCKQLFLTSFSEGFSALVAGVKSHNYVSKYIVFCCRDVVAKESQGISSPNGNVSGSSGSPGATSGGSGGGAGGGGSGSESAASNIDRSTHYCLPTVAVDSVLLQMVGRAVDLAFHNFVHRNDVGPTLFRAFGCAVHRLSTDDRISCSALFYRISWALRVSYIVDMELLVGLVDAVKPLTAKPNPVGSEALQLLSQLFANLRNANSLQRKELNRLFVGGPERSFRRVPAYVITVPYAARSSLFPLVYWSDIDQRRGENPNFPTVLPAGVDPMTRIQYPQLDDTTTCLSNNLINIFQALHELEVAELHNSQHSSGDYHQQQQQQQRQHSSSGNDAVSISSASPIDLRLLFSIAPTVMASLYPDAVQLLDRLKGLHPHMSKEALDALHELYMMIQDRHRPASGSVKFRSESPRLPIVPLKVHKYFEKDDLEMILKAICDDFSTSCDARISDRDVACLHPTHHMSLRNFVDSSVKIVLCGGGGLLRRSVTSALRLQQNFPGAFLRPMYYLLPLGYGNDIASWLARVDAVYRERVFNMIMSIPVKSIDPPTPEQWSNIQVGPDLDALLRRDALNDFVTFATQVNDIVVYQAECQFVDPFLGSCYLPFVSNFEIGAHVNTAVAAGVRNNTVPSSGVLSPSAMHSTSFSTEKNRPNRSGLLSRQNTNQSSSDGGSGYNLSSPQPQLTNTSFSLANTPAHTSSFAASFSVNVGERSESLDRILTRMHGARGIPISTKRHTVDGSELLDAASGEDILDWISTSYHLYDISVAKTVAQHLLDNKLLVTLCVPLGKDATRFTDTGIYALLPREEMDSQPLCPPASRSLLCEQSNLHRIEFEEQVAASWGVNTGTGISSASLPGGGQTSAPTIKVRATFQSFYDSALQYNDLVDSKETVHRDIVSLKLKSAGSADDIGPLPDPTSPTLVMTVMQEVRRKSSSSSAGISGKQRDIGDLLDHYKIKYGEKQLIDPRSVLQFDWKPSSDGVPGGGGGVGGGGGGTTPGHTSFGGGGGAFASNASMINASMAQGMTSTTSMPARGAAEVPGMYCMCDGDVFGPFSMIRVKPVAVKMSSSEQHRVSFATASVMSFVKPLSS